MATYAKCCGCGSEGLLEEKTKLKDLGVDEGGRYRQCKNCGSLNVDVMSEEGLAYEQKGEAS